MNQNFVKVSNILKDKYKVENYDFMLQTINPNLDYIDNGIVNLHNLEFYQYAEIYHECIQNPWFFFRNIVKIPIYNNGAEPFDLNLDTCAMIWCYINNISSITTHPKQAYTSTTNQAIWVYNFIFKNDSINLDKIIHYVSEDAMQKRCAIVKLIPAALLMISMASKNSNRSKYYTIEDLEFKDNLDTFKDILIKCNPNYTIVCGESTVYDDFKDESIEYLEQFMTQFDSKFYDLKSTEKIELCHIQYPLEDIHDKTKIEDLISTLPEEYIDRDIYMKRKERVI